MTTLALLAGAARAAPPVDVTDENVESAIQRAAAWLESKRGSAGHWETATDTKDLHWAGTSALAALALLYAGREPHEAALQASLDWIADQTLNGTYAIAVRAHALALVPGRRYRARLEADLAWLLRAVGARDTDAAGAYNYTPIEPGKRSRWDNSVSQFGVLGVWTAADAGLEVPEAYWETVGQHWIQSQNTDGGWGYQAHDASTGSMTAAGLASLFVALDQRYTERPREAGGLLTAIELGLTWLGREYGPENPRGSAAWRYYYMYGVERVGAASGHKYFRNQDWFRGIAAYLLEKQREDGAWPGSSGLMSDVRNTAFALMVLCHGRAPLLFNKLQHGNDWDTKLRDVAGLTRYAGHTFERVLNWQIVRLDSPLADLLEAPVLYMYGESKRDFSETEVQKVREYCQRGGLLLAVAGKDNTEFVRSFEALAARAFPSLPLKPVLPDHPLFTGEVQFEIKDTPPLAQVHNGVRTLMLLSSRDLAASWNRHGPRGSVEPDFQLAANIYLYATDKQTPRSRLQTPIIADRNIEPERTITLARIKYDGAWDPEPYGWTRLATYLRNETATRLLVTSGVTLDSPELREFSVAHITGMAAVTFSAQELRGLREFISAGGTLLADAAGGSPEFLRALEAQVGQTLSSEAHALAANSPLLTGAGVPGAVDLAGVEYRRASRSAAHGEQYPRLRAFLSGRRPAVICSPLDLSFGLIGTQAYDVRGYAPESALRIVRNLVLYAGLPSAEKARLEREP